ncbi:MAG: helix-turn-helix domain-containing protein [Planctomycetaceae bacterium]|nr:helix-turn-helix domain-containing protein [Planctomycetaceae bacterium]
MVAMTPFLTIEQAAHELGQASIVVLRLIARRKLTASRVGEDGDWKITPEALAAYAKSGCPDLAMPPVDRETDWFDFNSVPNHIDTFKEDVRNWIRPKIPATLKQTDQYGRPARLIDIRPDRVLLELVQQPPYEQKLIKMAGRTPPKRLASRGLEYASLRLRSLAHRLCAVRPVDAIKSLPSLLRLYSSPTEYERIVNEAWRLFELDDIFVKKVYTLGSGDTVAARCRVRHEDLQFNRREAIDAAF